MVVSWWIVGGFCPVMSYASARLEQDKNSVQSLLYKQCAVDDVCYSAL